MWRLFYPLRYFRLINDEKWHIDLWPTIILTALIAAPFIFLPGASFFHNGGFLDKLLPLTGALTGFYVAALVAAATFTNPDFDKVITVGPIKVRRGKSEDDEDGEEGPEFDHLTRREFTTTVFGYLAFNALILAVGAAVFIPFATANLAGLAAIPKIGFAFAPGWLRVWRAIFVVLFSAATAHLIVVTCLGLYYLMGRMYHKRPRIITKKHDKAA